MQGKEHFSPKPRKLNLGVDFREAVLVDSFFRHEGGDLSASSSMVQVMEMKDDVPVIEQTCVENSVEFVPIYEDSSRWKGLPPLV